MAWTKIQLNFYLKTDTYAYHKVLKVGPIP